ncbi:SMP-30/gluconolactonase/LRE family protein [Allomuricauda sp. CP2A]|uniref:SMP-30/gluconolactonase/LRE family protein n=1 Tax=Allomuricauda sp. CP2A TaxID=1848189 RepID=UPI0009F3DED0|nr:SMP-30/gluconolactonase/LRE family protein [Muricauda sp. CP2A]
MKRFILQCSLLVLGMVTGFAQNNIERHNASLIAFTVPEKDLIPESIAYDPVKENFFMGSTRKGKIVKLHKNGKASDFITADAHGLWMVIGIKIDVERRILWVCSSGGDNLEGYDLKDDEEGRPAGVFKFDLDSGTLLQKYIYDQPGEVHFFNDITVALNGDVYVTHMFQDHAVYRIKNGSDKMEKAYVSELIKYPNGIALSENNEKLYVAHSEGIALVDMDSGQISALEVPEGLKISRRESIDGLYFYKNSLVGVQTDINTVIRLFLDESGEKIFSSEALEINHPMMDTPTTGELVKNDFYYIANAQFGKFNENGLLPMEKLYEPVVLKVSLED